MLDTRTGIEKVVLEKKLNIKPGMLYVFERFLADICWGKIVSKRTGKPLIIRR